MTVGPEVGRVTGVVGARGGAGATTCAALLAHRLARRGPTVLVQLGAGPSCDALLGTEGVPGVRWPDLVQARGAVDPARLAALLRRWRRCGLLAVDDARPGPPPDDVLPDVLEALVLAHRHVVLDLDRAAVLRRGRAAAAQDRDAGAEPASGHERVRGGREPVAEVAGDAWDAVDACRTVLVVVPRDVPAVTGARALAGVLRPRVPDLALLVRGPAPGGLGVAEVEAAVDVPVRGVLPAARRLAARVDAGAGPSLGRRGDRVLDRVVAAW